MEKEIEYFENLKRQKKETLDKRLDEIDKYCFWSKLNWRISEAQTLIKEIQYLTNVIVSLKSFHNSEMQVNMKWNKITTRQLTDEERECYGPNLEYMWDGVCPDIDEEVIVFDKRDIYIDTFRDFDEGAGFYGIDEEEVYWMSLPKPPKGWSTL